MVAVTVRPNLGNMRSLERLKRIRAALTLPVLDTVVHTVAQHALDALRYITPKLWTGNIREGWEMTAPQAGMRVISNAVTDSTGRWNIMRLLEFGTGKDTEGWIYPRAVHQLIRSLPKKKRGPAGFELTWHNVSTLYVPLTARARFGYRRGFVYGVDYVMAKRVRGIRATHIVQLARQDARMELRLAVRQLVKDAA